MKNILYISNIAGKRMAFGFSGAAIMAARELELPFYSVANRQLSTAEDIKADEERYGIKLLHIDLERTPYSPKNIRAYKQLCEIIKNYDIDCIHCNTPVGGLLGRLAGKKCGVKKVIYQAHGFHFYKGAPKLNWLVYYPIECFLAHWTDALITINKEDYQAAQKFHLRNHGKIYYVPGVGIDTEDVCRNLGRNTKRQELGLNPDDFAFVSAGRLEPNKNNETLIRALAQVHNPKVKMVFCGDGPDMEKLKHLAEELRISDQTIFLGNRSDMKEIYLAVDALAMASFREGLSRTIMEAMTNGLPCVVSKIRGNVDLIEDGVEGYLCSPSDVNGYAAAFSNLAENAELRQQMGNENLRKIKDFDIKKVTEELKKIYTAVLCENV